jgi:hypothetical protein
MGSRRGPVRHPAEVAQHLLAASQADGLDLYGWAGHQGKGRGRMPAELVIKFEAETGW